MFLKVKQLVGQWKESQDKVSNRKQHLESMLAECKHLSSVYDELMSKIGGMEQRVESLPELAIGKDTLKRQKTDYKIMRSELNQLKQMLGELNEINRTIVTNCSSDDTSTLKVKYDRLAARFQDMEARLAMHGDGITDALQTIDDYNGQVDTFSQWLYKIEQDLSYLEDYCIRSDNDANNSTKQTVIELYQELQKEIDGQNGAYSSLTDTSTLVLDSMKNQADKDGLRGQLEEINKRWCMLRKKSLDIR